jgi:RNA polymerase sigma-70 factor, ECF subfamily
LSQNNGQDGWQAALGEQIRQRGRLYFLLAYRIVHDEQVAEDVCQHALCQAWQHREKIGSQAALGAWLSRTVINRAVEVLRRRGTERRFLSQLPATTHAAGPGEQAARHEAVWAALATLEEPTRTVVTLRLVEGFTGQEVKDLMGISASEVSRRLHRGMDHLRARLREFRCEMS